MNNKNNIILHISDKLEVSNLIPTILNDNLPNTEILLDNYEEFKDNKITLYLIKKNKILITLGSFDFKNKTISVPTEMLNNADIIKMQLTKNNVNTILYLDSNHYSLKKVYASYDQENYFNLLQRLLSKVIELDVRLQALELKEEQEII